MGKPAKAGFFIGGVRIITVSADAVFPYIGVRRGETMNPRASLRIIAMTGAALLLGSLVACTDQTQIAKLNQVKAGAGIVNGYDVKEGSKESKYLVFIVDQSQGFTCTGTLISDKLVLTAAHCVGEKPENMKIFFGTNPVGADELVSRDVVKFLAHESYVARSEFPNDIALIRFDGGLPDGAKVARLGNPKDLEGRLDLSVLAIGYGRSDGLNAVDGKVSETSGRLRAKILRTKAINPYSPVMTVLQNSGGTCFGDSGGPALLVKENEAVVMGVASGVYNLGEDEAAEGFDACSYFSEYTFVPVYQKWIKEASDKLLTDDSAK